jgi:hypothetical protein
MAKKKKVVKRKALTPRRSAKAVSVPKSRRRARAPAPGHRRTLGFAAARAIGPREDAGDVRKRAEQALMDAMQVVFFQRQKTSDSDEVDRLTDLFGQLGTKLEELMALQLRELLESEELRSALARLRASTERLETTTQEIKKAAQAIQKAAEILGFVDQIIGTVRELSGL